MVMALIYGQMVEFIKVNGKIIKWTDKENSSGLTVENIQEIMQKIKSKDMGNLIGQMAENIGDNGLMENR